MRGTERSTITSRVHARPAVSRHRCWSGHAPSSRRPAHGSPLPVARRSIKAQPSGTHLPGGPTGLLGKKPRPALPEHLQHGGRGFDRVLRSAKGEGRGPFTPSNYGPGVAAAPGWSIHPAGCCAQTGGWSGRDNAGATRPPHDAFPTMLLLCTIVALGSFQASRRQGFGCRRSTTRLGILAPSPPRPRRPDLRHWRSIWRRYDVFFAGFTVSPLP